jgi:hypothetical protein
MSGQENGRQRLRARCLRSEDAAPFDRGLVFRDPGRLLPRSSEPAGHWSPTEPCDSACPGSSDVRRPLEPGEHGRLGAGAGERRFPPTRCERAFLDGAARASTVHRRDSRMRGDVDLCAHKQRRLLVPAAPRAHRSAPVEQERGDRRTRCAQARLAAEGHGPDAAPRVAALPTRRRLRRALDSKWEAPPGLRFTAEERGPCFVVSETARSGISCIRRTLARYDACFPQRRHWRVGDLAACGGLGRTNFVRWTITERS